MSANGFEISARYPMFPEPRQRNVGGPCKTSQAWVPHVELADKAGRFLACSSDQV